jgi:hypothetical protein
MDQKKQNISDEIAKKLNADFTIEEQSNILIDLIASMRSNFVSIVDEKLKKNQKEQDEYESAALCKDFIMELEKIHK